MAARTATDLESARARILEQCEVRVECHALDLSESYAVAKLAARCAQVDILVNNAGEVPSMRFTEMNEDLWRKAWDLKVFGYINLTRELYRIMQEKRRGVIVNVIGISGERLRQNHIAASTGNAALIAFTKTLGGESVDYGVRVVGVNPGQIDTDRLRTLYEGRAKVELGDATRWRELIKNAPFGRLARADEVADAVVWLASPRASYVSGTVLNVDGGRTVRNT
jgi:NAD(P)-dependent dehydrogenase (short-subunit alcohol dehydrogenase family)